MTKEIVIDMTSVKGISLGERKKARLENDGWTLVKTYAGFTMTKLTYQKEQA